MAAKFKYRKEALIRRSKPEALDEPLRVTAPNERFFAASLVVLVLALLGIVAIFIAV